MNTKQWQRTLVGPDMPIKDAMRAITAGSLRIGLVVDADRHLVGTVTDGDIRRGLLKGITLDAPVSSIMYTQPQFAPMGTPRDDLLALMKLYFIQHVPLIDGANRVVGLTTMEALIGDEPERDNWVVLMAGGQGSRLRPLTETTPKSLLPIGDKPLLGIIIENFVRHSFRKFYVSVNYKAEAIKEFLGDGTRWNIDIRYLEETMPHGTAGALSLIPERPSVPVLVMNSDLLTSVNFQDVIAYHEQQDTLGTMCVREYDLQVPFGVVDLDGHSIRRIDEKPVHKFYVNAGIYVLDPSVIDIVPKNTSFDMTELFDMLIARNRPPAAFPVHEYWLDVGRMDDLVRANSEIKQVFPS